MQTLLADLCVDAFTIKNENNFDVRNQFSFFLYYVHPCGYYCSLVAIATVLQ